MMKLAGAFLLAATMAAPVSAEQGLYLATVSGIGTHVEEVDNIIVLGTFFAFTDRAVVADNKQQAVERFKQALINEGQGVLVEAEGLAFSAVPFQETVVNPSLREIVDYEHATAEGCITTAAPHASRLYALAAVISDLPLSLPFPLILDANLYSVGGLAFGDNEEAVREWFMNMIFQSFDDPVPHVEIKNVILVPPTTALAIIMQACANSGSPT